MSPRIGKRAAASIVLAAAAITVITLSSIFVIMSVEAGGNNSGIVSQHSASNTASGPSAASPSATCPLPTPGPPDPIGGFGYVGTPPFRFVGADSACVSVVPSSTSGSSSYANFTLSVNATNPILMGMTVYDLGNGSLTVPSGTAYNATLDSQTLPVSDEPMPTPTTVNLPAGITAIDFRVSVPNPYESSTYHFFVILNVYPNSSASHPSYENEFEVNLVAE